MQFTAVDAFSGAGGLCLGLQQAGFDILYSFDFDKICVETHRLNSKYFSHRVDNADIKAIDPKRLLDELGLVQGELDLLAGGPPCQGFSMQRTVGGDEDDRNLLVHHYGDLIKEILPKFFLMENVAGLGGKRGRVILEEFVLRMERLGYRVEHQILDAQEYGVPQRRKRMIVVGEFAVGKTIGAFKWPEKEEVPPRTVRETIGHLPPTPPNFSDHPEFPGHRADRLSEKNRSRLMALSAGQDRTNLPDHLLADCHRRSAEKIGHRNVYGRMEWNTVAPTITARFDSFTRGKFGHPEQIRTISLYEGSLLQTFPKNFSFAGTKVEVARQIGNAVPPVFAEALAQSIVNALSNGKKELPPEF
jgi:DNA (cytosine-5)-methyltransferase 1